MQSIMTGECHCGAVTYRIRSASLLSYVCHCGNCQKRSGSACGMGMVRPIDEIEIEGELSCWAIDCWRPVAGTWDYGMKHALPSTNCFAWRRDIRSRPFVSKFLTKILLIRNVMPKVWVSQDCRKGSIQRRGRRRPNVRNGSIATFRA